MKLTSKDKLILQSLQQKHQKAQQLRLSSPHLAIEMYHKLLFLKQDPLYYNELASIYQELSDLSSALVFYKRSNQLFQQVDIKEKIKEIFRIQGLELLAIGSVNNIVDGTEFQPFIKRYSPFHKKIMKKVQQKTLLSDYLESALAYLELNQRELALSELENCLMISEKDIEVILLKGMLHWSLLENEKGFKQFWNAYKIDRTHNDVVIFLGMIEPQLQNLYKEAKYDLIEKKTDKCRVKVKKGLQLNPYHTNFLILSAYLHRIKEQYELALSCLQLANKNIENLSLEPELRSQISLTYNEMGIYLFKQKKYNEALTLFTEGLTFKPNDKSIITNRGDCYKACNNYVAALEDYSKAYHMEGGKNKEDVGFRIGNIYNARGISLFNSKNYQHAIKQFEEGLKYAPKCAQFYLNKAKCLIQMGRKPEAITDLEKCVGLDSKNSEGQQLLGEFKEGEEKKGRGKKIIVLNKQK